MSRQIRPGLLYRTNETVEEVFPKNGKKFTLEELQGFVGGYIEMIPYTRPVAYCNEEGRLKKLPFNTVASIQFDQILCGDVIQTMRPLERKKR